MSVVGAELAPAERHAAATHKNKQTPRSSRVRGLLAHPGTLDATPATGLRRPSVASACDQARPKPHLAPDSASSGSRRPGVPARKAPTSSGGPLPGMVGRTPRAF